MYVVRFTILWILQG